MMNQLKQHIQRSTSAAILGLAICGGVGVAGVTIFGATSRVAHADDLPKAEDLITKYIDATGGKEAYNKITSRVVNGGMSMPAQGINGTIVAYSKAPNMMFVTVDIPGVGQIERGYNGTDNIGWEKSQMQGTRVLKGDELERVKQEAMTTGDVEWKKIYKDAKTIDEEKVGDKDCYKVEMTTLSGKTETRYYDKATALLVQTNMDMETPQGVVKVLAKVGDYRDIDGVKVPFKNNQEISVGGMQITQDLSLNDVKDNIEIPDEKFAVPEDVKELAAKEKEAAPAATTKDAGK